MAICSIICRVSSVKRFLGLLTEG